MDSLSSTAEKVKGFAKSSQDFVVDIFRRGNSSSRNPIEILKRLQRETFSDLMKLRDRQDKVERIISYYKTTKGKPFQEASTRVRGEVDALGAILLMRNTDSRSVDSLFNIGTKPGICSRFTFETSVREKDVFVAELVAGQRGESSSTDALASQLSLAKVLYMADVNDWCSATAIPVGARFRDFDSATKSFQQGRGDGLLDFSASGPPLLHQHSGSAIGMTLKKPNIIASLAQSISTLEAQPGFNSNQCCLGTFGQVICHLPKRIKLSLLGLHQIAKSLSNHHHTPGAFVVPVGFLRNGSVPESRSEPYVPPLVINGEGLSSRTRAVALKLEAELNECTRIGGWMEMTDTNPKHLQWGVSVSDNSEDEFGWGMSVGGIVDGPSNWEQFRVESYLKFNFDKRFSLKPGIAYITNGDGKSIALMLGSNWSL